MTGRSYAHADCPEGIAQFFISELHVDRFPPETAPGFAAAARNVMADSVDPLPPEAAARLERLETDGSLPIPEAMALLPALLGCFGRQHPIPTLADYETLLAYSAEMAWIATEGNAFNHATDRVADVESLSAEQKALGQPMKDKVEVSGTGRCAADCVSRGAGAAGVPAAGRDGRAPGGSGVVPGVHRAGLSAWGGDQGA